MRFWKRETPVVELEPVVDREAELIKSLHELDQARERVGAAMKDFRRRNTLTADGVQMYQTNNLAGRPMLDAAWNALLRADSKLIDAKNRVLADLAKIRCPNAYN